MFADFIEAYDIKTAGDILSALKEMLGDTIQHILETELDTALGYGKHARTQPRHTCRYATTFYASFLLVQTMTGDCLAIT
jgi:hypothetical protein